MEGAQENKGNWWNNAKQWVYFYRHTDKNNISMLRIPSTSASMTNLPIKFAFLDMNSAPINKPKLFIAPYSGLLIDRDLLFRDRISPQMWDGDAC